jgi:hypothetical protein
MLVAEANNVMPPHRAYDLSFVRQAGTAVKQGSKPCYENLGEKRKLSTQQIATNSYSINFS